MSKTASARKTKSARTAAGKTATKVTAKRPTAAALRSVASLQNDLLGRTAEAAAGEGDDAPTERQMEIYAFIRDKIHSRGYGPTVREIGAA
ncbi:MAG: hypothetical protein ACKO6B_17205, partial [Planctomycetia bacterium]